MRLGQRLVKDLVDEATQRLGQLALIDHLHNLPCQVGTVQGCEDGARAGSTWQPAM